MLTPLLVERARPVEIEIVRQECPSPGDLSELGLHRVESRNQHLVRAARCDLVGRRVVKPGPHFVKLGLGDAVAAADDAARASIQHYDGAVLQVVDPAAWCFLLVGSVDLVGNRAATLREVVTA